MSRAAVIGEAVRVQGYAMAGAVVYPAEDANQARAAWRSLPARLGPHLLGGIFDGLLRPLTGAPTWLEPGRSRESTTSREFEFTPEVAEGAADPGRRPAAERAEPGSAYCDTARTAALASAVLAVADRCQALGACIL